MAKDRYTGDEAWEHVEYQMQKRSTEMGLVNLAMSGDREALQRVAAIGAARIWDAANIPEPIKSYLCEALEAIQRGERPDHAFGYTTEGRSGNKINFWKDVRDRDMAMCVQGRRDEGMNRNEAIEHVANTYTAFPEAGKVGRDAVAKAYARFFPSKQGKK